LYEATTGETESRNTEYRQDMTEEERKATPPDQTADRPYSKTIVTFNGQDMQSSKAFPQQIDDSVLIDDEIVNAYTPGKIEDTKVFVEQELSGFANHTENIRSRSWQKLNETINNSFLAGFKALGNLNAVEVIKLWVQFLKVKYHK